MLTDVERARLTVVLVGARNPSNIGAAARAMQDFGFTDLRIVNAFAAPFEAAQIEATPLEMGRTQAQEDSREGLLAGPHPAVKSAVGAATVMARARRFDELAAAIADCTLVAGTTAIGERGLERPVLSLQQASEPLLAALRAPSAPAPAEASENAVAENRGPRLALLFGSEKTGLTNLQLSHCSLLLNIPMFAPRPENGPATAGADADAAATRHLSMNLGQAVAVCLYELTRAGFEHSRELPLLHQAPATSGDRERLTQLLLDLMHATGYARRFPAHSRETVVRGLVQQLGATHDEAATWMGILRQALRHEPNNGK